MKVVGVTGVNRSEYRHQKKVCVEKTIISETRGMERRARGRCDDFLGESLIH